jgi:3-hydroxymyristoyl/3-hydroxydecanoyl-(acyl carrier protein) dehydratases
MVLNKEEIMEIIPHRQPFLFVDEINELEVGKWGKGKKYVEEQEYYFKGHFPGNPVMPGVLQVEALAQVGAVVVLSLPEFKGKTALFGGMKKAKFRKTVKPGDALDLSVEIIKLKSRVGCGLAKAYVGDDLACSCEITFIITD